MPCFNPMQARVVGVTASGKKKFKFIGKVRDKKTIRDFIAGVLIQSFGKKVVLPCGTCVGCRLERSRQWALRIMHEAHFFEANCFITLTYDDPHLPENGSLVVRDFQLFMKRFRKMYGSGIRFFHCGEYGSITGRPHYHACIFNFDFPDKVFHTERNEFKLYTSKILSNLWGKGYCSVGSLTFESAAYVARYIMKKINGKDADLHYAVFEDDENGVLLLDENENTVVIKKEYVTMSRRPGIGKNWFNKYFKGTYDWDSVVKDGREVRVPKYYDSQFEFIDPNRLAQIKESRKAKAERFSAHNTPERLEVREKLQKRRLNFLPRQIDGGY